MKKWIMLLTVSLLITATVDAQMFKIGLKGGVGFSRLTFDDITGIEDGPDVYDLITGESVAGYHIGLQSRVKLGNFYVQPEVYWNAGGGTVEQVVQSGNIEGEVFKIRFGRIDIPVLAGIQMGPVRINAGPVGSVMITEDSNGLEQLSEEFATLGRTMGFGFQAGIGFDVSRISVDARYEGSLTKYLGDEVTIDGNPYTLDARPSQWLISIGYWFN
ncbi:MAG: PorT family protein [Bacteroidales bacterium]|nr:PorT family protein [Bacteroidales bacterium]MBN2698812.1 PorT family protein [Bacteroidales bacterium]